MKGTISLGVEGGRKEQGQMLQPRHVSAVVFLPGSVKVRRKNRTEIRQVGHHVVKFASWDLPRPFTVGLHPGGGAPAPRPMVSCHSLALCCCSYGFLEVKTLDS